MAGPSALWQTTCSALKRGDKPGWDAVEAYRQPLTALLARRYRDLPEASRCDVVQDTLVAVRERLYTLYDPDRGPFRAYLSGVIRNLVARQRREQARHLPLEAAPEAEELPAAELALVELGAELLAAVRAWHDRSYRAGEKGQQAVYVVTGKLVHGRTYKEIAAREKISPDAVKRVLSAFRLDILRALLERGLPPAEREGVDLERLATIARDALVRPKRRARLLAKVARPALREAFEAWLLGFDDALSRLGRSVPGAELRRGLEVLLDG